MINSLLGLNSEGLFSPRLSEMPRFSFDFDQIQTRGGSLIRDLGDGWILRVFIQGYYGLDGDITKFEAIDISRKSTVREYSVSVELNILAFDSELVERKFSRIMKPGCPGISIATKSDLSHLPKKPYRCYGHVDIKENSYKYGMENGTAKNGTQLKKTGNFISLKSDPSTTPSEPCRCCGHVDIKENSDRYGTGNGIAKDGTQQKSVDNLSNDLECLLDSKTCKFSDVTLKCGDVSIPAHRCILSARSPVFAAMFTKESTRKEVVIADIEVSTMRALLLHMYTGKTDLTGTSASYLLCAAEKYQLQDLKAACIDFLEVRTPPVQNVSSILVLGVGFGFVLVCFLVFFQYCFRNQGMGLLQGRN